MHLPFEASPSSCLLTSVLVSRCSHIVLFPLHNAKILTRPGLDDGQCSIGFGAGRKRGEDVCASEGGTLRKRQKNSG